MVRILIVGAALFAASSCGGIVSCDRPSNGGRSDTCMDIKGATNQATWSSSCPSLGGHYSESPCDRTNVIAGCKTKNGSFIGEEITTWFYVNDTYKTEDDVRKTCDPQDEVFVTK
jgi:hypothetical protein